MINMIKVRRMAEFAERGELGQLSDWWRETFEPATAGLPENIEFPACPGIYAGGLWQYYTGYRGECGPEVRETDADHWLELVRSALSQATEHKE